jgi:DNA primase catalytic core
MARIPEAEIEQIKAIPLEQLVAEDGIELKAQGDNMMGLCPFYNDNNPSLVITRSKNLFHCLGCGAAGSTIDWVMKQQKISFRHAVEILKQRINLDSNEPPSLRVKSLTKAEKKLDLSADEQSLLNQVIAYYHDDIAEARDYLANRWIDDEEMINRFKLGFSNRTLGYYLPNKQLKAGKESRNRLIEIGLLRESGHEHFRGSLIIPIFDERGDVVEVYGRKVTERLREGTPLHLYLKGEHKGVWNREGLAGCKEIILCEH